MSSISSVQGATLTNLCSCLSDQENDTLIIDLFGTFSTHQPLPLPSIRNSLQESAHLPALTFMLITHVVILSSLFLGPTGESHWPFSISHHFNCLHGYKSGCPSTRPPNSSTSASSRDRTQWCQKDGPSAWVGCPCRQSLPARSSRIFRHKQKHMLWLNPRHYRDNDY
jgi:hypothetical protein